ncbi:PepSY domain-containing protein, partial [Pseudomonas helleri]
MQRSAPCANVSTDPALQVSPQATLAAAHRAARVKEIRRRNAHRALAPHSSNTRSMGQSGTLPCFRQAARCSSAAAMKARPVTASTFIAVQPLHFADYRWVPVGGSLLRAVHFGMALAAAGLVLSGLYLWLERR